MNRPLIWDELGPKLSNIIIMMNDGLDTTKWIFDQAMRTQIPIDNYMPPVAGSIIFLHKLRGRIQLDMDDFNDLTLR